MPREQRHSHCREHALFSLHGRTQEGVAVFRRSSRAAHPPLAIQGQPGYVHFAGRRFFGLVLTWLVALLALVLTMAVPASDTVRRVKDIFPGSSNSYPHLLGELDAALIFAADDGNHGMELWRTSGQSSNTFMLKDINSGSASSMTSLARGAEFNGWFYFPANDGVKGMELWRTDGTTNGTQIFMDINPGSGSSDPNNFQVATIQVNPQTSTNLLFFTASDGMKGTELWVTDGTMDGTFMVKDIYLGPGDPDHDPQGSSFPFELTPAAGRLFFTAIDNLNGRELWISDATEAGTKRVKDINPGLHLGSNPSYLTAVNTNVFFSADDSSNGSEPWKSDGTFGGTVMVKNIASGSGFSAPANLVNFNGVLFFTAADRVNFDSQLWRSDGTPGGTFLVKQIAAFYNGRPDYLTPVGTNLFFSARESPFADEGAGWELWLSDGTAGGTRLVKDINPTTEDGFANGSSPMNLISVNGRAFFSADDGSNGREFWKSDGTLIGTVMVTNINPSGSSNPSELMSAAGNLFFTADDGSSGRELWVLDECDFEVTNTSDSGPGSLRQAILDSNAHANNPPERPDYICFDIPGGGVHTINLLSSLPPITQPLVIDGRTQPGYVLDPVIELRGASAALTGLSFTNTGNFKAIALAFNNLKFGIDITNGQNGVTLLLNTFIQIDTAGINAYLKTSGKYQFKQNRFTGNMLVGTKIDFDTNLTVTVEYNRNFHIGNKLGVSVRDSVNGKIDLISTGNSATNCENAGKLEIRANGNWNLDNNIWKASVNAAWTYEALLGPGTSARIRSLNEVVAGNGGDGMKVTANLSANAQFVHDVYGLISDHNGGRGYNVAVFGGPGIKASFNGYGWNVSGNVGGGIGIFNGSALLVGVKANIERSFITGNLDKGVVLTFLDSGDPILNNTITGNTGGAIRLDGGTIARIENNTISGSPIGIEVADNSIGIINNNSISANATAGVLVKDTASASLTGNTITGNGAGVALTGSGVGISIAGNAIYGNTGLGIDLGNDGVTLNDPGDADTGPNNLQNFPVLTSAVNAGGSSTVNGTLNSAANSAYTLRFFVNTGCHPSGYGEGAVFIGSTNVMTDGSGNASFTFVPASALAPGLFVTATATDAANNTSEFSQCRPVGAAAAPLLMVSQPDQSLVLISWPGSAPGFVLDFTTNLANPTSWSPVTTPVVMVNGQFTISITATNQREFFRLRQQ